MLRLTNSEMSCFRRCKRKWYLTYYRGLRPKANTEYGSPISIGNLVHDSLAHYYDPMIRLDPVLYAQSQVDEAKTENPGYEIEIDKEWKLVEAMLIGYLEWLEDTGSDSDLRLLGSETFVEVNVPEEKSGVEGGFSILSKLDAPVEQVSDGAKLALEHKTVASLDQPLQSLKIDTQLLTEHLVRFLDAIDKGASSEEAYDQCHGILYNMLRKVKRTAAARPPFYGRETVPHNIHELRNHWLHVIAIAREIIHVQRQLPTVPHHLIVPPSPGMDCKWSCPFFKICHMFDDNSRVEEAIEAMYDVDDPLKRYQGSVRF